MADVGGILHMQAAVEYFKLCQPQVHRLGGSPYG